MPRQARIKTEFGIFHIVQHGGQCRDLFTSNNDREKFISILLKKQENFNFILHGYCLIESNAYDLIIDVNGGDLSKIMKSINIAYALYVKCEGKVFSDRYKSYLLSDEQELEFEKEIIRLNKSKLTSQDSSCYNICYEPIQTKTKDDFDFEDCNKCIKCLDTASDKLKKIANNKGLSIDEAIEDRALRNELIKTFRKNSTLSLKTLGKLFGGLSESSISKILNNN